MSFLWTFRSFEICHIPIVCFCCFCKNLQRASPTLFLRPLLPVYPLKDGCTVVARLCANIVDKFSQPCNLSGLLGRVYRFEVRLYAFTSNLFSKCKLYSLLTCSAFQPLALWFNAVLMVPLLYPVIFCILAMLPCTNAIITLSFLGCVSRLFSLSLSPELVIWLIRVQM